MAKKRDGVPYQVRIKCRMVEIEEIQFETTKDTYEEAVQVAGALKVIGAENVVIKGVGDWYCPETDRRSMCDSYDLPILGKKGGKYIAIGRRDWNNPRYAGQKFEDDKHVIVEPTKSKPTDTWKARVWFCVQADLPHDGNTMVRGL